MRKLVAGIHQFQSTTFQENRELFERLAKHGQSPLALFVGCCDSRVVPSMITHCQPGDLFVMQNIGNIVPHPTRDVHATSTAAAVEYAVDVLKVADVIVCGHSHCGAMGALCEGLAGVDRTPALARWLTAVHEVVELVDEHYPDLSPAERLEVVTAENVLLQVEHLRAYPSVSRAIAERDLRVHAWIFEIDAGKIHRYDPVDAQFKEATESYGLFERAE
jgi:carbonic anhydrase